ncbi:MAG: hypothetical protein H7Y27_14115 [Gemmatimonadaceae bacterium]|nr:hypothetical protein [Chitinophagaceae bacterium]
MKKLKFVLASGIIVSLAMTSCGDSTTGAGEVTDTTVNVTIPPPDNSSATNPSLADTNFAKQDSAGVKHDTTHKH